MPANRRKRPPIQCRNQRGAAAMITVLFLLIVVGFAVLVSLDMSGSDVSDSTSQHNSVQALFLAESGLEEVAGRMPAVGGCAGIAPPYTRTLGAGSFTVVSAGIAGVLCQVRVSGTVGNVTRTVDGWLTNAVGAVALDATRSSFGNTSLLSFSHPVAAGASILVVGISIDRANTAINNVSYAGQALTPLGSAGTANRPEASIWFLLNPPAGTANVQVSLGANERVVAGTASFFGVNTTTPFDIPVALATGNNNTAASVTLTPVTDDAWIFEVVAVNDNHNLTPNPAIAGRIQRWEETFNNRVTGAGSTIGPVSPAAARTPRWTWTGGNESWAQAAAALRPGGSPQLVRWSEVVQ
jgi:hypothetical protein